MPGSSLRFLVTFGFSKRVAPFFKLLPQWISSFSQLEAWSAVLLGLIIFVLLGVKRCARLQVFSLGKSELLGS